MKTTLWLSGCIVACASSAGGPEYASLSLRGSDMLGRTTDRACVELPVMPGGRLEQVVHMGEAFAVHVVGTREGVELAFSGVENPEDVALSFTHDELVAGVSETVALEATDGDAYEVFVTSPCPVEP